MLISDAADKTTMSLLKDSNGKPILKVYEGTRDNEGVLQKGTLLSEGSDYTLIPTWRRIYGSLGGHFDRNGANPYNGVPDPHGDVFLFWDYSRTKPGYVHPKMRDDFTTTDEDWEANNPLSGIYLTSQGIPVSPTWNYADFFYSDYAFTSGIETKYLEGYNGKERDIFQIMIGENRVFDNEEPRDNRTFIVEYAVEAKSNAEQLNNFIGVDMHDGEILKVNNEDSIVWSDSEGSATGYNHPLTIEKRNAAGEMLNGATFTLEKKMGTNWQTVYPTAVLGEFTVNGSILREGLTNGLYRLVELTAPVGYQKLAEPIYFKQNSSSSSVPNFTETNAAGGVYDNPASELRLVDNKFILTIENEVEKRNLIVEKTWDFSADNILVNLDDLEYYLVKVDIIREKADALGHFNFDEKIDSLTLNYTNSFKASVDNLPTRDNDGLSYRYAVKEVDITDSRTGKSILSNFMTTGAADNLLGGLDDEFDSDNRTVVDSNGNYSLILKNTVTPKAVDEYVKVAFKKAFSGNTPQGLVKYVEVTLFRQISGGNYQALQTIKLDDSNSWSYLSERLDKKNPSGVAYQYFIKETGAFDENNQNILADFDSTAINYTALSAVDYDTTITPETSFTITNTYLSGGPLPTTGGGGLKILYCIAIIGALIASICYLLQRKKGRHEAKGHLLSKVRHQFKKLQYIKGRHQVKKQKRLFLSLKKVL